MSVDVVPINLPGRGACASERSTWPCLFLPPTVVVRRQVMLDRAAELAEDRHERVVGTLLCELLLINRRGAGDEACLPRTSKARGTRHQQHARSSSIATSRTAPGRRQPGKPLARVAVDMAWLPELAGRVHRDGRARQLVAHPQTSSALITKIEHRTSDRYGRARRDRSRDSPRLPHLDHARQGQRHLGAQEPAYRHSRSHGPTLGACGRPRGASKLSLRRGRVV